MADEAALIDQLIELVGDKISQRNGIHMIENLIGKGLITNREGTLILSVIEKSVLHQISEQEQAARAQLLKTFCNNSNTAIKKRSEDAMFEELFTESAHQVMIMAAEATYQLRHSTQIGRASCRERV